MYYYKIVLLASPLDAYTYHHATHITPLQSVIVTLQGKKKRGVLLECVTPPSFSTVEISEILSTFYTPKQLELARFIAKYYVASLGDALGLMQPHVLSSTEAVSYDTPLAVKLSSQQQKAFEFLQNHKVSLLFGDTGSGKTEIYIAYFQKILEARKQAVFLMPEISLTPQMQKRLCAHFGDAVVIWHSKLTPKQKKKVFESIENKTAKIIAGARSALFLPLEDLGLIVVDEEHDDSYKSASRPRYHARDIAIYMGKLYDIPVVLGSATPSLSSYVKFPHTRLQGGYFTTTKEYIYEKGCNEVTPFIIESLKKVYSTGKQSIVFVPTRANFKYLACNECGKNIECVFCSVGMSIHQKSHALKCHYCNYTQAIPQVCPSCHSSALSSSRIGSAEVTSLLHEVIPNANIVQFDRDSVRTNTQLKKVLKDFNEKKIDILVGTQMLSKGHDYHDVALAVVLGIDNILHMSDYRAHEKALSMFLQVAGRSGRKEDARVIIQTLHEDFFQRYYKDYALFLEEEKSFREGLYPPFKKLCRILFAHKDAHKAQDAMRSMEAALHNFSDVEIVGAKKCAIEKVANKYRFEILLRSEKSTLLLQAIYHTLPPLGEVDMDPIEFG